MRLAFPYMYNMCVKVQRVHPVLRCTLRCRPLALRRRIHAYRQVYVVL